MGATWMELWPENGRPWPSQALHSVLDWAWRSGWPDLPQAADILAPPQVPIPMAAAQLAHLPGAEDTQVQKKPWWWPWWSLRTTCHIQPLPSRKPHLGPQPEASLPLSCPCFLTNYCVLLHACCSMVFTTTVYCHRHIFSHLLKGP
jgi:hypothetical protein